MGIKYYDTTRVLSQQRNINFIVGQRGYGKTYGYKKHVIRKAINGEGKFVYMRRKQSETQQIVDFTGDLDNDPVFEGYVFKKQGVDLYYANEKDSDDKWLWEHMGTIISLSTQANMKSREFGEYKYLIFDEWLPLTENGFLRNELTHFLSALDTIFRNREFYVFCLGNSSIKYNPYFEFFDIYPNKNSEFVRHPHKSILLQNIISEDWKEERNKTPLGELISGTDYSKYANDNKFLDDDSSLVEERPTTATNIMVFKLDQYIVGVWRDDDGMIYFSEKYNSSISDKYTFDYEDIDEEFQSYKNLFNTVNLILLQNARKKGKIRFTSIKAKAHSKTITQKIRLF